RVVDTVGSNLAYIAQRRGRQRARGGICHRTGHIGNAIKHLAVNIKRWVIVRGLLRIFKTAALVNSDIHQHGTGLHIFDHVLVTNFGAAAPGMSTAPMTRSASRSSSAIVTGSEIWVRTRPWYCSSICCSTCGSKSNTVTSACNPAAIATAEAPTWPPPITTTRAGLVPGTPGRSTPRPPSVDLR